MLGEDFKQQFENLKPKEELDRAYREDYQNFIKGHFPTLLKMVDVRRPADEKEPAARRRGGPDGPAAADRRRGRRTRPKNCPQC